MMRILQPATNSRSSHIQAVAGALLVGLIFGFILDWKQTFLIWWFWPMFVLAISPHFLWRLSGWTEGFSFGFLQILRLLLILHLLGVTDIYGSNNDAGTFGKPTFGMGLIAWIVGVILLLTVLQGFSSRPDRDGLRPAVDLVTPALGLPTLAIWLYRFLQLPSPTFGQDYRWVLTTGLFALVTVAILIPFILSLRPVLRWKVLSRQQPEKPGQILVGLAVEMALIFALFGCFRTLIGLTAIGWDELYRSYAGNFIFSLIRFFKGKEIFILLLLVSSYCAVPWKPVQFRRALLGALAALVVISVAIHYPVFYRRAQFPPPPAAVLKSGHREWRMGIPLDLATGIRTRRVSDCRYFTFYRYLNPVALAEEEHCVAETPEVARAAMEMLNSASIHPAAAQGYIDALWAASPIEFIRYEGRSGIYPANFALVKVEPTPETRDLLEKMEHDHSRLYPNVACGFASAFHHFGDEQRTELYLAMCGPHGYQETFNQIYLSQSVVKGRVVEVPWPRNQYRMDFALSRYATTQASSPIGPDGSFNLTGVETGKHEGWIIVHGNPGRYLGPKKDLLVVYSNSASFEVNGIDPVDLGDIWIKIFPDHPAPELLPAASAPSWFEPAEDNHWDRVKNLVDPFSPPDPPAR